DLDQALCRMFANVEAPLSIATDGSSAELLLFACPPGPQGKVLRDLTRQFLPSNRYLLVDLADEWLVYREWSGLPWRALPQCNTEALQAYLRWQEYCQTSPHSRIDVTDWQSF
ncbi:MAG: hypothetical protein NZU63_14990, partial [Gemmataceae bacterium]|nr:hypothetical protein [Gemmataceae bacterium]